MSIQEDIDSLWNTIDTKGLGYLIGLCKIDGESAEDFKARCLQREEQISISSDINRNIDAKCYLPKTQR